MIFAYSYFFRFYRMFLYSKTYVIFGCKLKKWLLIK